MARYIQDPATGRLVPAPEQEPEPRSRLERWEMRDRQRADTTAGYSRFVRIMKVMLPVVALSLVAMVIIYSANGRDGETIRVTATELKEITADRALVAPKLIGTDGRGQPFTVTAKGASVEPGKASRMTIDDVKADITMLEKRAAKDKAMAQGDIKRLENCATKIEQRLARMRQASAACRPGCCEGCCDSRA